MRPDPFHSFHAALRLGPGHCPPDLFAGDVPSIVRGLKAHANNISYARHMAMEATYPRLAERMGTEEFHRAVEQFLECGNAVGRSLDGLGYGFAESLGQAWARDLARAEWASLEAYGARDSDILRIEQVANMAPAELLGATLALHAAARLVPLEDPASFRWDEPDEDAPFLLVTRPVADVEFHRLGRQDGEIARALSAPTPAAALMERHASSLFTLITCGAIAQRGHS